MDKIEKQFQRLNVYMFSAGEDVRVPELNDAKAAEM